MTDASTSPSSALPSPGALIGSKYRVERYVAEGGMSVIAMGRHEQLDEAIALKFLKPDVIESDATKAVSGRFLREARATIKIRSEHVPRIFDVATLDNGIPYIVMELLVGEDLEQRLDREGPLPVVDIVDATLQALEAVAAAHALGIVHRDLKPANIFLATRIDGSTCAKVLDFGIAKLAEQPGTGKDHGLTTTNAVMGSPRYMSPEQMRGTRDVDARADIWAIGTTLFELLTGKAAFDGENLTQVCASVLQDEPASIREKRPEVPAELESVVRRCLEKRADDCYADVAELAAALAPFGSPAAHEAAARVARVLGATPSSSKRMQSATQTSVVPTPSISSPQVPVAEPSNVGRTDISWGAPSATAHTRRRRRLTTIVVGVTAVIGIVALGGILLRTRSSSTPTTASGTSVTREVASDVPRASAAPPASTNVVVPPPAVTPTVAETPTPSARPAPTAPRAPSSPKTAAVAPPVERPTAEPPVQPTTPPPPTTPQRPAPTPKAAPTARPELWDDRK